MWIGWVVHCQISCLGAVQMPLYSMPRVCVGSSSSAHLPTLTQRPADTWAAAQRRQGTKGSGRQMQRAADIPRQRADFLFNDIEKSVSTPSPLPIFIPHLHISSIVLSYPKSLSSCVYINPPYPYPPPLARCHTNHEQSLTISPSLTGSRTNSRVKDLIRVLISRSGDLVNWLQDVLGNSMLARIDNRNMRCFQIAGPPRGLHRPGRVRRQG